MISFARFSPVAHGPPAKVPTVAKVTAPSSDEGASFRKFRNFFDGPTSRAPVASAEVSQVSRFLQTPATFAADLDFEALFDAYAERVAICSADGISDAQARATAEAEIGAIVMRLLLFAVRTQLQ